MMLMPIISLVIVISLAHEWLFCPKRQKKEIKRRKRKEKVIGLNRINEKKNIEDRGPLPARRAGIEIRK